MDLDFQSRFQKIILKLEESGLVYAEAKASSWHSQELCSSIKASLMLKALSEIPGTSVAKAEIIAKASDDYKKHLSETAEKIRAEHIAKVEYEKWNASFEGNRSLCSLEKKTRQLIGD